MQKAREKIVVISKNASSLFGYASTLNELGYYSISLCNDFKALMEELNEGARYGFLIVDAFDLAMDAWHLQCVCRTRAVGSVIVISDVNSRQRQNIHVWAKTLQIALTGILQAPLRTVELGSLLDASGHVLMRDMPNQRHRCDQSSQFRKGRVAEMT